MKDQYTFFFSDIVGYSKMIQKDEELAINLLEEHNRLLTKIIDSHDGKVVKFIGDSVFAQFHSPDKACKAGLKIQINLKERNKLCRQEEHINIRLGIHMGSAVEKDDDLFGNDINIASRIEGICQSGSVFISSTVFENLSQSSNVHARKLQYIKLKNIYQPQTLYKLYQSKNEKNSDTTVQLLETLIENGVSFIDKEDILEYDKKSIGILLFESLGDDYYGYGLTNDLINDFDKINKIYVTDIQDVLRYKSSSLSLIDIARKLQVDNILDGVCRIENDRIFLSIRMLNITTGKTLWKEELCEPLFNINLLKANVIKKVLEILNVQVPVFILDKMLIGMTNDPAAYELYQQGLYKIEVIRNKDEYPQARKLFQQALEKDQNFVESLAQYAITSNKMGFFEKAEEMIDKALDKADEKNNDLGKAKTLDSMGIIYKSWNKYKKATACFEKALKIQVKYEDQLAEAKTLTNLSECYINLQEPDKGIEVLKRSIYLKEKLDKDNLLATSYGQLGSAFRNKLHYDNAINNFRKALGKFTRQNNEYYTGRVMVLLARCYCDIGDSIKALDYLENAENICIKFGESHILGRIKWIRGRILRSKNKYKKAIDQFEQSIAYFKEGELRKPIIESLMEIMIIQIASGQIDSLPKLTSEYSKIAEKLSDSDKYLGFLDCIHYLLYVHNGTTENINLNDIEIFLEDMSLSEEKYIGWWILCKASRIENNNDRKRNYHSKASEIIHQLADIIGNDTYKESFLKKHPIIDIIKY